MDPRIRCDCCGLTVGDRERINIVSDLDEVTMTCEVCEGWLNSGMLRVEYIKEKRRFRRWTFQWTPAELMPEVK